MRHQLLCLFTVMLGLTSQAQTPAATKPAEEKPKSPVSVSLYGFIRNDMNFDSRQMSFVREGQLDLYPKDKDLATNGSDYNKKSQLNLLGILTRFGMKITGPDAFGAKTSGQIEGDFFGQADQNIGLLRLRHGFVKLEWPKASLVFGQTWYPLFVPECFPGVVNFNTGIPIAPFGWAGQIKGSAMISKDWSIGLTIYKPREFSVASVNATENTNAPSMNATMPEINLHLQHKSEHVVAGIQGDYSSILPYTKYSPVAGTTLINKNRVNAFTAMAYAKVTGKHIAAKAQFIMGQNTTHWVMMGGYYGYKNALTNEETFKPAKTTAAWIDIYGTGKKIVPGLFVGYSANNGSDSGATAGYGRMIGVTGRGIKDLLRISPRIEFISGKLSFKTELEFTQAQYGTRESTGKVTGTTDKLLNTRFTFSTMYTF